MPLVVYEQLRCAILAGRLRPGAVVLEGQLAREHGVSKTPVREALQRLVHAELIEVMPGRGYRVHAPGLREARDLFAVRELLEAETAGRAARYATADEVAAMFGIATVGYVKGDEASVLRFHDANLQLHTEIAYAARNAYLAKLVRQLLERMQLIVIGEVDFGDPDEIVQEHVALCEAIARHDVEGAARLMRAQVRNGLQRFTGYAHDNPPT